ncbi:hypothetical protein [Flavobacterium chilense]|uniref:Uncharacterized protein n=1 Tax=Flavobacterium chilense TaxID=946677 RepID=A0A1M7GET6_9FLAO|nr:hypothetical protein [Flavobacterium chilense]SHM14467.1 hypothetical protein SAMN05444484_104176 [Flavobacterium chilense]
MENQYCYIEFDFTNEGNFKDLKDTFEVLKDSKNNSIRRDDKFWFETFPKYSLEKFTFLDSDLKPNFKTAEETELSWHFYSLIELLSINYEIEYIDLKETSHNKGILLYDAYSYPYGGINGLIVFLESFNCNPKIYDDGIGVYNYPHEELNKTKKSKWNFSSLKNLFKTAMLLLFFTLMASCNNKEKDLQLEKEVFYEVYPALIDSVWVNAIPTYVPPAPSGVDPSEYKLNRRNESKKRFNKELAESKQKKFPVDLVFFDEVIIRDHSKELQEHFKDAVISKDNVADTLEYKLDRKKLDAYTAFHLKYVSKIPRGNDRKFYNECCYSVPGIVLLSRIQFDDEKKYGVLTAGIECGGLCGYGYLIYIKKVNDKWVVDKIEDGWIA